MNRIHLLSELVTNQIAAGEVVERPASVVKELIENALDAKATRVEIEIRNGGKSLLRVTDDGWGMSRDDTLLALERHATSKISRAEDLAAITTMGFRGEALSSIAAVSRFRLISREPETLAGTEMEVAGGKILKVCDAGCPAGTNIEVRNLFFNVPARKKFLRSGPTEIAHIHQVCILHALARPDVAFRFLDEDRLVFDVAPAENLRGRLLELYSADFLTDLLPVEWEGNSLQVSGFVGKPGISRANRSEEHIFVNHRPVENRAIHFALQEGYHTALMKGRYPIAFLFLEMNPSNVDVNVHPTKREVRFHDDSVVRAAVIAAVRAALGKAPAPVHSASRPEVRMPTLQHSVTPPLQFSSPPSPISPPQRKTCPEPVEGVTQPATPPTPTPDLQSQIPFHIIGVLGDLYVLAEGEEGLLIMDQHAAHERVLFEQMLAQLAQGNSPSQKLLLPQTISLEPRDAAFLGEHLDLLKRFGFELADFGNATVLVDGLPPYLNRLDLRQLLVEVIDQLRESGRAVSIQRLRETTVATIVCRHAVKARDPLQREELERLLRDLLACDLPYTCPHGRPTMIQISRAELEKKFGRRV